MSMQASQERRFPIPFTQEELDQLCETLHRHEAAVNTLVPLSRPAEVAGQLLDTVCRRAAETGAEATWPFRGGLLDGEIAIDSRTERVPNAAQR